MLHLHRPWATCLVLAAVLGLAMPAGTQTVLLVVRENVDSSALPPPFPVREGLSNGLFDAGVIVLDAPGSERMPPTAEAVRLAAAAGAEAVVEVATVYTDTKLQKDLLRIAARTTWTVLDAATSRTVGSGTEEATNRDREKEVDRLALGGEIGRKVAAQIKRLLDLRGS
ncbi:MAG TPA: hypothetical protein VMF68_15920 [Spirochaetia bacterium]|nr:hypothetical protein [Spirochaetia bacterium]